MLDGDLMARQSKGGDWSDDNLAPRRPLSSALTNIGSYGWCKSAISLLGGAPQSLKHDDEMIHGPQHHRWQHNSIIRHGLRWTSLLLHAPYASRSSFPFQSDSCMPMVQESIYSDYRCIRFVIAAEYLRWVSHSEGDGQVWISVANEGIIMMYLVW